MRIPENVWWALAVWVLMSYTGSLVKVATDSCDSTYPVDYVLYNGWFCEIEKEQSE